MRLCFIDLMPWDYDTDTPHERPLGGMQSAVCHLTAALAAAGHEVVLATHTTRPGLRRGVDCLSLDDGPEGVERLRGTRWDAAVSLTAMPGAVRDLMPAGVPLFLWTGHAEDQPAVQCLGDPGVRYGWDGVVLVSEWQRGCYGERFGLSSERTAVLRNAIAPAFENLFADADALARAKRNDPLLLAYTSTPFRGLDLLAGMFPLIPRPCRLRVFSDMGTYLTGPSDSQFQALYDQCRKTPGIEHAGTLAQPELAEALRAVSILAYPCTFPETGCIAALEAMAAGCAVVASDLGALAETTAGHALLVDPGEDWSSFGARYLTALDLVMASVLSPPGIERLWQQVRFVNETATWSIRAGEWAGFFKARGA